jgi:hypothetical protein
MYLIMRAVALVSVGGALVVFLVSGWTNQSAVQTPAATRISVTEQKPFARPKVATVSAKPIGTKPAPESAQRCFRIGYRTRTGLGCTLLAVDYATYNEIADAADQHEWSVFRQVVRDGRAFWIMGHTLLQVIQVNRFTPCVRVRVLSGEERGRAGWLYGIWSDDCITPNDLIPEK